MARLRSPGEGLVADGRVDPEAIATLVGLRRRYLPDGLDGLDETSGLVVPAGSP